MVAIPHVPRPVDLIGCYRRFGDFGPVYEIRSVAADLPDGDVLLQLHLPETDEDVELRYSVVLRHPEAD